MLWTKWIAAKDAELTAEEDQRRQTVNRALETDNRVREVEVRAAELEMELGMLCNREEELRGTK